jgi:hypothetical protein
MTAARRTSLRMASCTPKRAGVADHAFLYDAVVHRLFALAIPLLACGNSVDAIDASSDGSIDATIDGMDVDGPSDSSSASDVKGKDAGDDGGPCGYPKMDCNMPCPQGTYCLRRVDKLMINHDLGCTKIPAGCNGFPTCDCMKHCFCTGAGETCMENGGVFASLICF